MAKASAAEISGTPWTCRRLPWDRMELTLLVHLLGYYVESSRLMINLAEAILSLFEVQKMIGHLSGLTSRVDNLINSLEVSSPLLPLLHLCYLRCSVSLLHVEARGAQLA